MKNKFIISFVFIFLLMPVVSVLPSEAKLFLKKQKKEEINLNLDAQAEIVKNGVLSLEDCINIALQNDPNLKISKFNIDTQKSKVTQAKSDYFPSLNGATSFNFQNNQNSYNGFNNDNNSNNYQINVGINELIWNFGKTFASINMEKYTLESKRYDKDYQELNTIYKVKSAYYNVLAAIANLDIYQRSVRINKINYDRTKALYEEGLKSQIDVVNSEVYLTDAEIQLVEAKNKYKACIIDLNNAMYLVGAPKYKVLSTEKFKLPDEYIKNNENEINVSNINIKNKVLSSNTDQVLTSDIKQEKIIQGYVFKPYEIEFEDLVQKAYENRPDLKSLQLVAKASKESLKVLKRSYLPSLNVSAGYNFRDSSNFNTSGLSLSTSLDIPVLNFLDIKAKINEMNSYLDIALENVNLSKKNIYFEVEKCFINLDTLANKIPLLETKVSQTLENFKLADGRYTVGLGNFIELQDAQTNYNNAQLSYVQTVFNYNMAKAQLEWVLGEK